MKAKTIVTGALLAFVAVSVVFMIAKDRPSRDSSVATTEEHSAEIAATDRTLIVYYFHGNKRCNTCRTIEAYTEEAIKTGFPDELRSGRLVWIPVNVDVPENGHFVEDFADRCKIAAGRDWPMTISVDGPFWVLREWCGFEGLCMMMIDDPELVDDMAEFYRQFIESMFERMLEHVVPDTLFIGEDMAYKEKPMISREMTRRWCMPSWVSWTQQVKQAGVPTVTVDSDGRIDEIIPMWIEAGVNICEPIEVAGLDGSPEEKRLRLRDQVAEILGAGLTVPPACATPEGHGQE